MVYGCSSVSAVCPPEIPRDKPVEAMAFELALQDLPAGLENMPKEQAAQAMFEVLADDYGQCRILEENHRALVEWIEGE